MVLNFLNGNEYEDRHYLHIFQKASEKKVSFDVEDGDNQIVGIDKRGELQICHELVFTINIIEDEATGGSTLKLVIMGKELELIPALRQNFRFKDRKLGRNISLEFFYKKDGDKHWLQITDEDGEVDESEINNGEDLIVYMSNDGKKLCHLLNFTININDEDCNQPSLQFEFPIQNEKWQLSPNKRKRFAVEDSGCKIPLTFVYNKNQDDHILQIIQKLSAEEKTEDITAMGTVKPFNNIQFNIKHYNGECNTVNFEGQIIENNESNIREINGFKRTGDSHPRPLTPNTPQDIDVLGRTISVTYINIKVKKTANN